MTTFILKEIEIIMLRFSHSYVYCKTRAKIQNQTKYLSIVNKGNLVYMYTKGCYSTIKKINLVIVTTFMELENILNEKARPERQIQNNLINT